MCALLTSCRFPAWARDMQIAKEAARAASDIREEVTAPLKASIEAGTYHVSTESFADKLFSEYDEMR